METPAISPSTYYPCERPLLSGNTAGCVVLGGKITHYTNTVDEAIELASTLNANA